MVSVTSVGVVCVSWAAHSLSGGESRKQSLHELSSYARQFVSVSQSVTDETGQKPQASPLILLAEGTKLSLPHISPRYTVELGVWL